MGLECLVGIGTSPLQLGRAVRVSLSSFRLSNPGLPAIEKQLLELRGGIAL